MWSVLENVPRALEKNVYSTLGGCNVLKIGIKCNCSIGSCRLSLALLIFCLEDLFCDVSGLFMSPSIAAFLLVSPFTSVV